MEVLVVYESVFGNTHEVADAVAEGIRSASPSSQVRVAPVGEVTAEQAEAADAVVVGGPTHIRGMSHQRTRHAGAEGERKAAAERGQEPHVEHDAEGPGLREWFDTLPRQRTAVPAAAFDTRAGPWIAGGASHGIVRRLKKHGFDVVAEEGFTIEGQEPVHLQDGELDRARRWGADLQRLLEHDEAT